MTPETRFWHPFADMSVVRAASTRIVRGAGTSVWDSDGQQYFDGTSSLWCVNVGHGRDEIADVVAGQMRELASYSTFGGFTNGPAEALTQRLSAYAADIVSDPRWPEMVASSACSAAAPWVARPCLFIMRAPW